MSGVYSEVRHKVRRNGSSNRVPARNSVAATAGPCASTTRASTRQILRQAVAHLPRHQPVFQVALQVHRADHEPPFPNLGLVQSSPSRRASNQVSIGCTSGRRSGGRWSMRIAAEPCTSSHHCQLLCIGGESAKTVCVGSQRMPSVCGAWLRVQAVFQKTVENPSGPARLNARPPAAASARVRPLARRGLRLRIQPRTHVHRLRRTPSPPHRQRPRGPSRFQTAGPHCLPLPPTTSAQLLRRPHFAQGHVAASHDVPLPIGNLAGGRTAARRHPPSATHQLPVDLRVVQRLRPIMGNRDIRRSAFARAPVALVQRASGTVLLQKRRNSAAVT